MNGCIGWTRWLFPLLALSVWPALADETPTSGKGEASEGVAQDPKGDVKQPGDAKTQADSASSSKDEPAKYLLRYRFPKGQTLRWEVLHQALIETSVSGTTQVAETVSKSVKVWTVSEVDADGNAMLEYSVEDVDMRHRLTGRDEVRYNSSRDKKPPRGFEDVCGAVGVPLASIKIDPRGKVLHRDQKQVKAAAKKQGQITIPLPDKPVAVGDSWSHPADIDVSLPNGMVKKVKAVEKLSLRSVATGVATIEVETQILTPIHDPAIEAQLIQNTSAGIVKFDIDAGRMLQQQMDVDKRVVGFRGEASAIRYLTRFSEKFVAEAPQTARKSQPEKTVAK